MSLTKQALKAKLTTLDSEVFDAGVSLPAGTYKATVDDIEITDKQIYIYFKNEEGRRLEARFSNSLTSTEAKMNLKRTASRVLKRPAKESDIAELLGMEVAITISFRDGYSTPNVYIASVDTLKTVSVVPAVEEFDLE